MEYLSLIIASAKSVSVPASLLIAICTQETGLKNTIAFNDGSSHSFGVCQVKKLTAQMLGFKGEEQDLMNEKTNIKWAARYLKFQMDRYNQDWCQATAAYNAGTFNPSKKNAMLPRNLYYVKSVKVRVPEDEQFNFKCLNKLFEHNFVNTINKKVVKHVKSIR